MDHFGIGAAMQGMAQTYFQTARRTGRTVSLVESVKDGDRLIFTNRTEADRVYRLCQGRGVIAECIVIDPSRVSELFERGSSKGRTIFDHSWVEQWYLSALENACKQLDTLECETSGYGEAHRETKRKAQEISRWAL